MISPNCSRSPGFGSKPSRSSTAFKYCSMTLSISHSSVFGIVPVAPLRFRFGSRSALQQRQGNLVFHRRDAAQIHEHGFEIVVGHDSETFPRHRRQNISAVGLALMLTSAHRLNEVLLAPF